VVLCEEGGGHYTCSFIYCTTLYFVHTDRNFNEGYYGMDAIPFWNLTFLAMLGKFCQQYGEPGYIV
jgi:hypothetical protein